ARQGGRLRDPGARRDVRRASLGQLLGRNGSAAVRDGRAAARLRRRDRPQARDGRVSRQETLINATPREVRAALVEGGVLQEVLIERASRRGLISNIYKGRVSRVLPGMQAAFVDIGLERTAFLHASDVAR